MPNFFISFRRFVERDDRPRQSNVGRGGYLDTIKKQMRVPKKLWMGLPLQIDAGRTITLDGKLFKGPLTLSVDEFDNATVTVKLIRNPMDFSNMDDQDDEYDPSNTDDGEEQTFVIPRLEFEKLLEPNNSGDFATASQTAMAPH